MGSATHGLLFVRAEGGGSLCYFYLPIPKSHQELQLKEEVYITVLWKHLSKGEEERLAFLINGFLKEQRLLVGKAEESKEEKVLDPVSMLVFNKNYFYENEK